MLCALRHERPFHRSFVKWVFDEREERVAVDVDVVTLLEERQDTKQDNERHVDIASL